MTAMRGELSKFPGTKRRGRQTLQRLLFIAFGIRMLVPDTLVALCKISRGRFSRVPTTAQFPSPNHADSLDYTRPLSEIGDLPRSSIVKH